MDIPNFKSVVDLLGEKFLTKVSTTQEVMMARLAGLGYRYVFVFTDIESSYRFIDAVRGGEVELNSEFTLAGSNLAFRDEHDAVLARLSVS